MEKTTLNYYNPREDDRCISVITGQETIEAETDIELFEQFYKLNNRLRYCNGSYYKWVEAEWETKYQNWLKSEDYKKKSFNLYYGGGVVD